MPVDPDVVIVFGTLLAALIASLLYAVWYQTFKMKHKSGRKNVSGGADNSIGVSELEEVVRRATKEATQQLDARLAGLESDVRALLASEPGMERGARERVGGALPEHRHDSVLEIPPAEPEAEPTRHRSRVR